MTKPTIYLTNFASRKPPHRGSGRVYSIMAKPRPWECGDGRLWRLTPVADDLAAFRSGAINIAEYRRRCLRAFRGDNERELAPGILSVDPRDSADPAVADGDTLCCACSREAAARGECHRVWAAELLAQAGWRVILDGVETAAGEASDR